MNQPLTFNKLCVVFLLDNYVTVYPFVMSRGEKKSISISLIKVIFNLDEETARRDCTSPEI